MGLLVNERDIVVPGDTLAEGMDYIPGEDVFRDKDRLISMKLGLVSISGRQVKILPLAGSYVPTKGDIVIGKVVNIGFSGWRVDMGWAFEANLSAKDATTDFVERNADLSRYFDYGDYLMVQIVNVTSTRAIDITTKGPGLKKLGPGRMIKVQSIKVPRIIGKQGSMITMIKESTGTRISVGQNGIVWLSGDDPKQELLAVEAIRKIEKESHTQGLTDRIKSFLEENKNGI